MADLGIQQSPAVPTHVAGVRSGTIADWKRRPLVVAAYPLPLVLSDAGITATGRAGRAVNRAGFVVSCLPAIELGGEFNQAVAPAISIARSKKGPDRNLGFKFRPDPTWGRQLARTPKLELTIELKYIHPNISLIRSTGGLPSSNPAARPSRSSEISRSVLRVALRCPRDFA
jgi:hypothetical protein